MHQSHDAIADRNSGVRRHRAPFRRLTHCDRPERPFAKVAKASLHKALRRADRQAVGS